MKDVLVLFDGTRIELEDYSSIDNLMHIAENDVSAVAICDKITLENVSRVEMFHGDDRIALYRNLIIAKPPIRYTNEDGTVTVVISLRERTSVEARLDALEESQNTQDGAIEDLGMAVSDLVEG